MRPSIISFIFLCLLLGCKQTDKLTFEPLVIKENTCADCPKIAISLPKALEKNKVANSINTALEEELIMLLLFDEEIEVTSLEEAITSFKNGYLELKNRYSDETAQWEAKIDGEVTYEDDTIITIALNSYLFTGGAHGYSSKRLLNFNKKRGVELENWQLFKNSAKFQAFAEAKFREKENIPKDKSINYTGFMFERDAFYLPENIGFTAEGIKLLYNQYEVASYADGTIELVFPYNEVKKYLVNRKKS